MLVDPRLEDSERLIPAYTPCNTYSTSVTFSGVPELRIIHNYFLRMRLLGVTAATVHDYLVTHPTEVREYFYSNWQQLFATGRDAWLTDKTSELESFYPGYLNTNLENDIHIYRADYFLSPEPLSSTLTAQLPSLKLVADLPHYYLYKF